MRLALLFSLIACVPASSVRAQDADDEQRARAAFTEGMEALQERDFQMARTRFEESLELMARAPTAFNLGVALTELGECQRAIQTFGTLLDGSHGELSEQLRNDVEQQRARSNACLATVRVTCGSDFPVEVTIGDDRAGELAVGEVLERRIDPGTVVIEGSGQGAVTLRRELELARGESRDVTMTLETRPPPAQSDAEQDVAASLVPQTAADDDGGGSVFSSPWFWLISGALVAAGAVAIVLVSQPSDELLPPIGTAVFSEPIFTD